ncbi:MAG: glycosyltransferase family A protein [Cyclobacteriaceae bacterium]
MRSTGLSGMHQNEPLVSIVIPTFNRADFLPETLDSILVQTYRNWECIVVDDGSTDYTKKLVETNYLSKDSRFQFHHRRREPKGAPTCRNIGFELSKGELINWFDSDDIMHPQMLEKKVELILQNPDAYFAVCRLSNFSSDPNNVEILNYQLRSDQPVKDFLSFRLRFYTPGPLFKRAYLESFESLFDERLIRHQESEFYFRVILTRPKYAIIEEQLILRRIHENSIAAGHNLELENNLLKNAFLICESYVHSAIKANDVKNNYSTLYQVILKNIYSTKKLKSDWFEENLKLIEMLIDHNHSGLIKYLQLGALRARLLLSKFRLR